ncbi:RNA polymerase factor sigma-54 [Clostridium rectalis]|uniref:RNA polymerase factor sigma-54 n=1 Tax=Clostridium rectalis TaxID=2040295 RepID=UPI0019D2E7D7|nr:RNA polymerase factor sigma-54 [Clostridium rectalis]
MDFNLTMTQEQKLVMTQQMQLSIKILQLSSYELQKYVEKEVEENPVLEIKEVEKSEKIEEINYKDMVKYLEFDNYGHSNFVNRDEEEVSPFTFISEEKSLKQYLREQISESDEKDCMKVVCNYIVENIDDRGYLCESTDSIAEQLKISKDVINYALDIVQDLEPDGIGARDLKECLSIQCKKKRIKDKTLYLIIENHLQDIAENKYGNIAKKLGIDIKKAQQYGDFIKTLQPKPSRGFYTGEEVKYVVPDAYIKKIGRDYHIIMNDDLTPRLTINKLYRGIIQNEDDKKAIDYVKNRLDSAIFLMKSIDQRKSTIYKVLEEILEKQIQYFDLGDNHLKPMTLKEIAEKLNMHESTISRAIKDKYIHTNRGTIKIKDLFTTAIPFKGDKENLSSIKVKKSINELIDKEDKKSPLSDQAICDILKENGVNISRRTVAKYREEIGLKSSKGRRRY